MLAEVAESFSEARGILGLVAERYLLPIEAASSPPGYLTAEPRIRGTSRARRFHVSMAPAEKALGEEFDEKRVATQPA